MATNLQSIIIIQRKKSYREDNSVAYTEAKYMRMELSRFSAVEVMKYEKRAGNSLVKLKAYAKN
jgi:hypothetical protein